MELDDLQIGWGVLDRRIKVIEAGAVRQREAAMVSARQRPLWFLGARQVLLIAAGLVFAIGGGSFWFEHRDTLHLLLVGLSLHLYGVIMIVGGSVQLAMISQAHASAPVVEFQERIARLRRVRIVTGLAMGLPWWIVWVTLVMAVAAERGVDLYVQSPAWVWWNLAIGAVGMLICGIVAHRVADKPVKSAAVRAVVDSLTGRNLRQVAADLEELNQLKKE